MGDKRSVLLSRPFIIVYTFPDSIQESLYNNDTIKLEKRLKQLCGENVILEVFK